VAGFLEKNVPRLVSKYFFLPTQLYAQLTVNSSICLPCVNHEASPPSYRILHNSLSTIMLPTFKNKRHNTVTYDNGNFVFPWLHVSVCNENELTLVLRTTMLIAVIGFYSYEVCREFLSSAVSLVLVITESSRFQTRCCEASEIVSCYRRSKQWGIVLLCLELLIEFNCSLLNVCAAIKIHHE
jgi:hypothetical protein